ncbi:MAG: thioredoxin family protein [Pseudomonadota bacterium]|nr:thioredoxin family protein [Pseudomonadota bacterium]
MILTQTRALSGAALVLICALIPVFYSPASRAEPTRSTEVEVELIAEARSLQPGENWVALRVLPNPGWHVYWRNPGDSGIPTKLEWTLPSGVSAGEIHWPYPHAERLGDLTNYGYSGEVLHLVPVTLAAGASGGSLTLQAKASWLACKDVCIPGKAELSLSLPVTLRAEIDPDWAPSFAKARSELPRSALDWPAQFAVADNSVSLSLQSSELEGAEQIAFFPFANDLVNHAATQRLAADGSSLRLSQALSPYYVEAPTSVDGVVVIERGGKTQAWEISAKVGEVETVPGGEEPARNAHGISAGIAAELTDVGDATNAAPPAFALVLLLALVGGLILNLMPCVFPVLSLKALALVRHADTAEGAAERRRQTYAYTLGVVLSCVAIAAAMLGLRSAGEAVGWGFQLQSPAFVALMAYVIFALGLSLSGVVEFGVGAMNLGSGLAQRPGLSGSFFTGVLAVVVASPCTAPFMGSALGYAMTQPAAVSLLVFATLGLGLALPFLLLGWFPALARWLPRPGAWMEQFKQFMAFPLYLTVVWLLWVLSRQTDAQAAAQVMLGLVAIAFALWLWHRSGWFARVLKLTALAAAIALLFTLSARPQTGVSAADNSWSTERVAALRTEGRTIFVDFTADWCLSCKVNERTTLHGERVQNAFSARNVVSLVGDWTRSDPLITAELARFGRNGVPLYLVYVNGGEPKVLPQLLTPEIVIDALD